MGGYAHGRVVELARELRRLVVESPRTNPGSRRWWCVIRERFEEALGALEKEINQCLPRIDGLEPGLNAKKGMGDE